MKLGRVVRRNKKKKKKVEGPFISCFSLPATAVFFFFHFWGYFFK